MNDTKSGLYIPPPKERPEVPARPYSKKLNNSSEIGIDHKYIDAELLMNDLIKSESNVLESLDVFLVQMEVANIVESQHAADVIPVVHASFVPFINEFDPKGKYYKCSNCGSAWNVDVQHSGTHVWFFCPSCGARMDGDEHE